jgi:hypothetical protein
MRFFGLFFGLYLGLNVSRFFFLNCYDAPLVLEAISSCGVFYT